VCSNKRNPGVSTIMINFSYLYFEAAKINKSGRLFYG
jgi:hypothetical protein